MKFDHRFALREAGPDHRVYEADGVTVRLDFVSHMLRVALSRENVPLLPTWGAYAQAHMKDTIHAGFFAVFCTCCALFAARRGEVKLFNKNLGD